MFQVTLARVVIVVLPSSSRVYLVCSKCHSHHGPDGKCDISKISLLQIPC